MKTWQLEFTEPETRRLTLHMGDMPPDHYILSWIGTNGTLGSTKLEKQ